MFDFLKINQNTKNYPPGPLKFEGGFDGGHGSVQKSDMLKKGVLVVRGALTERGFQWSTC